MDIQPGNEANWVWDPATKFVASMVTSVTAAGVDPVGKHEDVCYVRPVEVLRAVNPAVALPDVCPYRGLGVLRQEDAGINFGREKAIRDLLGKIAVEPFVALPGVSGAGKSSLLRAGLKMARDRAGSPA